ncbi:MAG: hypothetical protein FJW38_00775 [Acidobacteria bacterium]|nr:hypothetical protein [Acidobacteriota bacterium]
MTDQKFRRAAIAFAALALVLGVATTVRASHSWGNYHWARTANPFTIKLGDKVTSVWDSHLQTASSDWTASSVLNTSIVGQQQLGAPLHAHFWPSGGL